jgi:hypothetical protein
MNKPKFKIASPAELQNIFNAALRRQRAEYGAAPTSIEALMLSLRSRGSAALAEPNTQRRLSELSPAQVGEVIARLTRLQPQYPAINDELIDVTLKELIK